MKNIEELAQEWVANDAKDPYSGGYIATIIDGLLNRIAMLRDELREQWIANHDEHCTNMNDCGSFVSGRECHWPRPPLLAYQNPSEGPQDV